MSRSKATRNSSHDELFDEYSRRTMSLRLKEAEEKFNKSYGPDSEELIKKPAKTSLTDIFNPNSSKSDQQSEKKTSLDETISEPPEDDENPSHSTLYLTYPYNRSSRHLLEDSPTQQFNSCNTTPTHKPQITSTPNQKQVLVRFEESSLQRDKRHRKNRNSYDGPVKGRSERKKNETFANGEDKVDSPISKKPTETKKDVTSHDKTIDNTISLSKKPTENKKDVTYNDKTIDNTTSLSKKPTETKIDMTSNDKTINISRGKEVLGNLENNETNTIEIPGTRFTTTPCSLADLDIETAVTTPLTIPKIAKNTTPITDILNSQNFNPINPQPTDNINKTAKLKEPTIQSLKNSNNSLGKSLTSLNKTSIPDDISLSNPNLTAKFPISPEKPYIRRHHLLQRAESLQCTSADDESQNKDGNLNKQRRISDGTIPKQLAAEPQWQKRLSQLFIPPSAEELKELPIEETESAHLISPINDTPVSPQKSWSPKLPGSPKIKSPKLPSSPKIKSSPKFLSKFGKQDEGDLEGLLSDPKYDEQETLLLKSQNSNNQFGNPESADAFNNSEYDSTQSFSTPMSSEGEPEFNKNEDGYSSWDDTICSNRSAYFKLYYQRGLARERGLRPQPSQNSLISLIKERMTNQMQGTSPEPKNKGDLGLKFLVLLLFLTIVIGISVIYFFYHRHLLEVMIFNHVKFQEDNRKLEIYFYNKTSLSHKLVATADLGKNISRFKTMPADCTHYLQYLKEQGKDIGVLMDFSLPIPSINESEIFAAPSTPKKEIEKHTGEHHDVICLEWMHEARLLLQKITTPEEEFENLDCFQVTWKGARNSVLLKDCIYIGGGDYGYWWGGGEINDSGYPLHKTKKMEPSPLITGEIDNHSWGHLLRHSFISSNNVLISLSPNYPVNISINHENLDYMCLSVGRREEFLPPVLNYSVCTADNISTLHNYMNSKTAHNQEYVTKMNDDTESGQIYSTKINEILVQAYERIEHPIWRPWSQGGEDNLTQDSVLKYLEDIISQEAGKGGHLLLPATWQTKCGSLTFDPQRFPEPDFMAENITRQGLRLALSVNPMVDSDSAVFKNGTAAGLWVRQYHSSLPVLTSTRNVLAAAVIDFTNQRSVDWFSNKLKYLLDNYTIDRFYLVPNTARALPKFHEFHIPLKNPDLSLDMFLDAVSKFSVPIGTEVTIDVPPPPTFMTLSSAEGEWKALETLIPRVITLSMLGIPLLDTGIIGGGNCNPGFIPEEELYIRWLQAAAYLPAFQVCVLPHVYNTNVQAIAHKFDKKRKEQVIPRFNQRLKDSIINGQPLISPLPLIFPDDKEALNIGDQWMIGNNLLVAPVLKKGERSRDVYLPDGLWKDLMDNHIKGGNTWLKDYRIPLTEIGLFRLLKAGYLDSVK